MDDLKSIGDRCNKILASWAAEDERSARRAAKRERQATALSAAFKCCSSESDDEVQLVRTLAVSNLKVVPSPNLTQTLT